MGKLCSDSFKEFIKSIGRAKYTIEDIADFIKDNMLQLAEDMNIGRLESLVVAPPNAIDRVGYNGRALLFQKPEGYNPNLFKMDFKTNSGVKITMNAYPVRGYEWNDDEKDDLYFLCANIFALFERARLASSMKMVAFTESMTGAANLHGLLNRGSELREKGELKNYTSVFLNIKNFKFINRTMGMKDGDRILRGFVDSMYGFLLPDEVICRLGGDNFVILIRDDRVEKFLKIISPMSLSIEDNGRRETVNVFFRVGLYDIDENDVMGTAISNGSTAIAETRKDGALDVIWFDKDMQLRELDEKETSYLFAQALANRDFVVYYQPKVKLDGFTLCGCEALVRWHRDGNLLSPMSFIPILEKDGSICELDFYVFETVCRDLRDWIDKGLDPVTVSVNFSKYHLKNQDFSQRIVSILERYNISPKYIEVELTESACYEDFHGLRKFIEQMREHNISVSIDDFGTGYSSLSLLKDLKVNVIKLDQSFVKGIAEGSMEQCQSDMIVIKNIINMVGELDMRIIAEGVESDKEMSFLRDVNCDMAQGFLFDKPMSHDDYEILLKGSRSYDK